MILKFNEPDPISKDQLYIYSTIVDNCLAITNKRKHSLSTSNGYSEVICVIMTL